MGKGKGLLILLCWVGELLGVGCILGILIFLGVCGFCFCVCAAFGKDEEKPEESVGSHTDANHRDTAIVPIGIQSVPFTFGNAQQHQNGKSLGESRNEQMVEIRRLLELHQLCKEGGNERHLFGQQQQQQQMVLVWPKDFPANVKPGQKIQMQSPCGQTIQVQIPPNMKAGMKMVVNYNRKIEVKEEEETSWDI